MKKNQVKTTGGGVFSFEVENDGVFSFASLVVVFLSLVIVFLSLVVAMFGRKIKLAAKQKQQEEEEKMKKMKEEEMKEEMEKMKKMKEEEMKEEMKKMMKEEMKNMKEEDLVWRKFIPSIYLEIIAKSSSSSMTTTTTSHLLRGFSSKKDLYCSLFDKPILIDGGSKSLRLEKGSGKICLMLGARALSIIWGSTPTYWTWRPSYESRFPEVAELLNVCWLEIIGKVETQMLSPKTMYGAYFVIKTAEQNHGLDMLPGQFSMRFVRGGVEFSEARRVFYKREVKQLQKEGQFPRKRGDGWMEIEMGEFYNNGENGEVEMRLLDTSGHWKCGLIVQGMEFRPK